MSDYEMLNQRVATQKVARRKEASAKLAIVLAKVLAAALFFAGLATIGFISEEFLVILVVITICTGAFNCGYIWRDIKF